MIQWKTDSAYSAKAERDLLSNSCVNAAGPELILLLTRLERVTAVTADVLRRKLNLIHKCRPIYERRDDTDTGTEPESVVGSGFWRRL